MPNAPITIGTIVTFIFHSFFNSLARSRYLSFFSLCFRFILWSAGTAKSTILQILLLSLLLLLLLLLFYSFESFTPATPATYWSLSDCKFPQVSRTLLRILADLINAVIWMVSTCLLVSKSSSSLVTIPIAPITIGITVTFMFHSFFGFFLFCSLARSRYLSLFAFFQFYPFVRQKGKVHYSAVYFIYLFLLTIPRSGRLAEIRWSVYFSKSQRILCVSFSRTDSGLCIYHLFVW